VIEPSSLQRRNSQLKEIARLRAEGALTESEFEAVKARLLSDEASAHRKKLVRRPQWTEGAGVSAGQGHDPAIRLEPRAWSEPRPGHDLSARGNVAKADNSEWSLYGA